MSFLSIVGVITLALLAAAALGLLVWLGLLGIERFILKHLEKVGLVRNDYHEGWVLGWKVPKDYSDVSLSDYSYRPSKSQVRYMIEDAIYENNNKAKTQKGKSK